MVEEKKDNKSNSIHNNNQVDENFNSTNKEPPLRKLVLKKLDNRSFDSTVQGVYTVDDSEKESDSFMKSTKDSIKYASNDLSSENSNGFYSGDSGNVIDNSSKDSVSGNLLESVEKDSKSLINENSKQDIFLTKEKSADLTHSLLNKESISLASFDQKETSLLVATEVDQLKLGNQTKEGFFSKEKTNLDSTDDLVALSSTHSNARAEGSVLNFVREKDQNTESQKQENEKVENWNAESQNLQNQNAKEQGEQKDNTNYGRGLAYSTDVTKEEHMQEIKHVPIHPKATNLQQAQQSLHNAFKGLPSSNSLRNSLATKKESLPQSKLTEGADLSIKKQESNLQEESSLNVTNPESTTLKEQNNNKSSNFGDSNIVSSIKEDKSYDAMKQDKFYENEKLLDEEFLSNNQVQNDLGDTNISQSLQQEETSDGKDKSEFNSLETSAKVVVRGNETFKAFGTSENFRASFSQELKQNIEDGVLQNIIPDVHIQNVKEDEALEDSSIHKELESLSKQESIAKTEEIKSKESLNVTTGINELIGNDSVNHKSAEEGKIVADETKNTFMIQKVEKQPEENNIDEQAVIAEKPKAVIGKIIPNKIAVSQNGIEIDKFRDQVITSNESNTDSQANKKNNSRELDTSKYSEKEIAAINKIDKVLNSVALLFKPFKEILRKTLPFLNPVLNAVDKFGLFIAAIVRFIAYKSPIAIRFIKGRIFKVIIIMVIFGFLFGILASRLINSKEYVTALENAIYDKTGYKVAINGVIKVNIIPSFGIGIKNVVVLKNQNFESDFALSQLSAEQVNITFKILPILFGNFEIDKIYLHQAVIDINIKNSSNNKDILSYENTIKDINKVTAFKVVKKTENNHKENLNGGLLQQLDNIIGSKEQRLEGDSELLNDVIIGEDTSSINKDSGSDRGVNHNLNALKPSNKDSGGENTSTEKTGDLGNSGDINSREKLDSDLNANPNTNQEYNSTREQGTIRNNVIETNTGENKGVVYNIFLGIVKNIKFDLQSVDQIRVARSKVNIVVGNNKINSLDNVEGTIKTSFLNKTTSQGSFRFMDINTYYSLDLDYLKSNKGVSFDFKLGTDTSLNNALEVMGTKLENGNITADVTSKGQLDLLLINKFVIPMDLTKEENHSFKAKLEVTPNTIHLKEINLLFPSVKYSGDLLWNLSNNYSNNAHLNLKAKVNSLEDYINSYVKFVKDNSSENTLRFSSMLDSINNWKNESINNFKFNYFKVNFNIEEAKLNNQDVSLSVAAIFNNDKIFVENFIIKGETFHLDAIGRVSLDEKNAMFILDSSGEIEKTASFLKLPNQTKKFLLNLGKNKEEDKDYSLATKLVINNNKFVFNEFKGHMGDRYFYDTYLVFLERSGTVDLLVKDRVDSLNAHYLSEIYRKQTEGTSNIEENNVNIFGLGSDFNININLVANTFNYKDIELKNAVIDMVLSKSGIRVKKFEASGKYGGSVVASFISDINVMPVVAGHLNLNNFVLKMEETDKFLFNGKNIIGDLYLNGQFRFSGDSYIKPFSSLEGQLTFVKYERIKLNRFANTDGLYMTLSEKKQGNKINYLLNDAYGRLNITNGVVDFYPVVMLYIYGNKEYRGTFEGSYDFLNDSLKVQGSVDNADNINNQMNFKVEGSLLNPNYSRKFTKLARSNVAVRQKEQVTKLDTKSYTIANKINNNKDKNNFNNTYNKNINKDESYIIDNIYNDTLDRALNSAENEDSFSSKYPIRK